MDDDDRSDDERDELREQFRKWEEKRQEEIELASEVSLIAQELEDAGIDVNNPPDWIEGTEP